MSRSMKTSMTIVAIVATDRYIGEDAAERVIVEYEPLPPVVGIDGALGPDLVHDDVRRGCERSVDVTDVFEVMGGDVAGHVVELDLDQHASPQRRIVTLPEGLSAV